MLYYTSFLFGIVAIHASTYHGCWMCPAFICILYLSTVNHMGRSLNVPYHGKHIVHVMDRALAHAIAMRSMYDAMSLSMNQNMVLYYLCLLYTMMVYHLGFCKIQVIHASMHFASCIGSHILMVEYHEQNKQIQL
jgi:hypothetical protein